jgi:MtN3 and saliva related transmembrane protein
MRYDRRMQPDVSPSFIDAIGYLAGFLTTIAFIPQVVKTWQSRSTSDLSLAMLATYMAGILCWLSYGVVLRSTPMILANSITFALNGALVVLKLRDGHSA